MADYMITDGDRFIYQNRSGKYVPARGEEMADRFNKRQAEMIYKNRLPKALRTVFYIKKINEDILNVKRELDDNIQQTTEKLIDSEPIHIWIEKLENLNGLTSDAIQRSEELNQKLSDVDKELMDIYHYLEFSNLNACQLCKAAKMIKIRRVKRRRIKNEKEVINMILDKKVGDAISDEIKENIAQIERRTYEPRILKELFET